MQRVLIGAGQARVVFRRGAVPRLKALRESLSDREVEVEVARLQPLSLLFRTPAGGEMSAIVHEALGKLLDAGREPVATG